MTGACAKGHPFDTANTYLLDREGKGARNCRACNREAVRRYKQTRKGRSVIARMHDRNRAVGAAKAGHAVESALRNGTLVRQPCGVCGATDTHAHHPRGYEAALDVVWLCPLHHSEAHHD